MIRPRYQGETRTPLLWRRYRAGDWNFMRPFFFFTFITFFFLANLAQLSSQSNENGAVERRESLVFLPFSFHVFSLSTVDQWLVFLWVFCLFFFRFLLLDRVVFRVGFVVFQNLIFLYFFVGTVLCVVVVSGDRVLNRFFFFRLVCR